MPPARSWEGSLPASCAQRPGCTVIRRDLWEEIVLVGPRHQRRVAEVVGTIVVVTVDLATLPAPLADAVRAARGRRKGFVPQPFVRRHPDPDVRTWAREVIESGDLEAAIAEVAASDPDLRS